MSGWPVVDREPVTLPTLPGGTQALDRTELLPVTFSGRQGLVPRPSLLGAIVSKAVAVVDQEISFSEGEVCKLYDTCATLKE